MSTWHIPEVSGLNLTRTLKLLCFSFSNDPILTVDSGDSTILVLSDSAAAFDTAHCMIPLSHLENCAGIKGAALKWLQSYLTDKGFFFVHLRDYSSQLDLLVSGVPQGSILDPTLFLSYMFSPGAYFW